MNACVSACMYVCVSMMAVVCRFISSGERPTLPELIIIRLSI